MKEEKKEAIPSFWEGFVILFFIEYVMLTYMDLWLNYVLSYNIYNFVPY
jgi:hypothetical protein